MLGDISFHKLYRKKNSKRKEKKKQKTKLNFLMERLDINYNFLYHVLLTAPHITKATLLLSSKQ